MKSAHIIKNFLRNCPRYAEKCKTLSGFSGILFSKYKLHNWRIFAFLVNTPPSDGHFDHYSVVRLEDACRKALTFTPSPSLKSVQAILKSEQDLLQTEDVEPEPVPQKAHRFTRGAEYYRRGKK